MESGSTHRTAVFLQPACAQHKFIRHPDTSAIVERPERLRAVYVGLAAAISRLEIESERLERVSKGSKKDDGHDLADILNSLSISTTAASTSSTVPIIHNSAAMIDLLTHPAMKTCHSDYIRDLSSWIDKAEGLIKDGKCEIPEGLPQNDLYLGPGSRDAIRGALATTIEAVDTVVINSRPSASSLTSSSLPNAHVAFAAIRPPGHHCGDTSPMGFCFVNNVVVAATHAYQQHGVDRVVILDIDLHHGNGTQSMVMDINQETHNEELLLAGGKLAEPGSKLGQKFFYGSLHDIWSFPCEDGNLDNIRDASVSLASHGQYIENIHLEKFTTESDFYKTNYPKYLQLLSKSAHFLQETTAKPENTLIFISAGFDACEHESKYMQRHGRWVPVSFYERFARDVVDFAEIHAGGKVVSVLEGGYGDRALGSAALAHLVGLSSIKGEDDWWSLSNLVKIEKATKKKRGNKIQVPPETEPWLARTAEIFSQMDSILSPGNSVSIKTAIPAIPSLTSRTLRDRTKIAETPPTSVTSSPKSPKKRFVNKLEPSSSAAGSPSATRKVISSIPPFKISSSLPISSVPATFAIEVKHEEPALTLPPLAPPAPFPSALPIIEPVESGSLSTFPVQNTISLETFAVQTAASPSTSSDYTTAAESVISSDAVEPPPHPKVFLKFKRPAGITGEASSQELSSVTATTTIDESTVVTSGTTSFAAPTSSIRPLMNSSDYKESPFTPNLGTQ